MYFVFYRQHAYFRVLLSVVNNPPLFRLPGVSGDLRLPADRAVPHPVPAEAAHDVTRYESPAPPSPSRR